MLPKLSPALALVLLLSACVPLPSGDREPEDFLDLLQASSSSVTLASSSSSSSAGNARELRDAAEAAEGAMLELGKPDAPQTLLVFTNHACEFCREFEETIVPRLREDFVDTGKLKIQTAILPLRKYPLSAVETAALFCAREQGKAEEMHRSLFTLSRHTMPEILEAAVRLKLNVEVFNACLPSPPALAFAEEQRKLAESLDVTLIPTLILNGRKKAGLPRYADLRGWIEEALD